MRSSHFTELIFWAYLKALQEDHRPMSLLASLGVHGLVHVAIRAKWLTVPLESRVRQISDHTKAG